MNGSLSIIIVNYKTPLITCDCLRTVFDQTTAFSFEVIVVDNASGDSSEEIIRRTFPLIRWIEMGYNAGFARANNEGIRQSSGDAVLLLNSDTLDTDKAIGRCYQVLMQSDYAACGVQLLNADRSPQISGNYFIRGGLNNLLPLPLTGAFIKWLGGYFKVKKPHVPDAKAETEVDWINGAFLMVKNSAIEKAGLMDEDFFLYAEEAEWCGRLQKAGRLAIFGQFNVVHLQGETSNIAFGSSGKGYYNLYDRKGLQIMLSNFVRIRKQFGVAWFLFQLAMYTFTIPLYFLSRVVTGMSGNKSSNRGSAAGYAANVVQLWGFAPTIIRNKRYFYKVL